MKFIHFIIVTRLSLVNGGGCTGLTYGMSAEAEPGDNDEVYEFHGLKVLVDKMDVPVLQGTTIDFKQSLMGCHQAQLQQTYHKLNQYIHHR